MQYVPRDLKVNNGSNVHYGCFRPAALGCETLKAIRYSLHATINFVLH